MWFSNFIFVINTILAIKAEIVSFSLFSTSFSTIKRTICIFVRRSLIKQKFKNTSQYNIIQHVLYRFLYRFPLSFLEFIFSCSLTSCTLFSCTLFSCTLFFCSLFSCTLFTCSLFLCTVYSCALFLDIYFVVIYFLHFILPYILKTYKKKHHILHSSLIELHNIKITASKTDSCEVLVSKVEKTLHPRLFLSRLIMTWLKVISEYKSNNPKQNLTWPFGL